MISCTEFIPCYSELFTYLEEKQGRDEVSRFWDYLFQPTGKGIPLINFVKKEGIRGCWSYWSGTLNEEAADFTMYLNEKRGFYLNVMHHCPSKGRLLQLKDEIGIIPYHDYCLHCDCYRAAVEEAGLKYIYNFAGTDHAACSMLIYDPSIFDGRVIIDSDTLVMDRKAADNEYFHRDFHSSLNMGIEYDPQYRFVTTETTSDGSKEKKLLYSSYGLKTAEAIDKEFHFVDDYGIPDPSDVSKTGDNVQIYYTNLDYTAGSEQIKLDLNLMTSDKTPMTFDVRNLSVVDLDSDTTDDDYKVSTSVEGGRVSYDPYDVPEESEEEYNSTPVTMPLTIKIPEGKKDAIRGLKLVYHVANKSNEEKNEDALRYTTESGTSIDESYSFKLPTPVMTLNTSTNKVEISTSADSGTYTKKDKNYYFYTYKGSYKEGEDKKEISISLKSETTLSLNNGEDITYEMKDNVISFSAEEKTYSFTLNKENRTLLGSVKSEDEEIKDIELKADLGAIKTLTTTENGVSKDYKLDLASENFTYYYKFKESDDWSKYDVETGIKSEDIKNNRLYVRSEYKYEDKNGEITIYSMVGQYVKPFKEDINVSFKIRLK